MCAEREGNKIIVVMRRESHISPKVVSNKAIEPVKDQQYYLLHYTHLNC